MMERHPVYRTTRRSAPTALALAAALTLPGLALAGVPGKKEATACYGVWEGVELTGGRDVDCVDGTACDGDGVADGKCVLGLQACTMGSSEGCEALPVTKFKMSKALQRERKFVQTPLGVPADLGTPSCGTAGLIELPLRENKKGVQRPSKRLVAKMVTRTDGKGRLKKGVNKIRMRCLPNEAPAVCPDRGAGQPQQLRFTVPDYGTDLDNGWTGISHNFPIVEGAELNFCLDGCDASTDPTCTGTGPVGEDTVNGPTFGAPLPLLTAGVPVCVVNEFAEDITADVDLETGVLDGTVRLASGVYLSSATEVCPRCVSSGGIGSTGTCSGGRHPGRSCTVEGRVRVENGAGNRDYLLSSQCLPSGSTRAGVIDITLPLTTGTSQLAGELPCGSESGGGVSPKNDDCGAGTCSAECTGTACVEVRDGQCIDIKGGISQLCCSSDTERPCFPSANDPDGITRDGLAVQPAPAWPDPQYPKSASDAVLAATFCEGSTGSFQVDAVTGLPGPGALTLTGAVSVTAGE